MWRHCGLHRDLRPCRHYRCRSNDKAHRSSDRTCRRSNGGNQWLRSRRYYGPRHGGFCSKRNKGSGSSNGSGRPLR